MTVKEARAFANTRDFQSERFERWFPRRRWIEREFPRPFGAGGSGPSPGIAYNYNRSTLEEAPLVPTDDELREACGWMQDFLESDDKWKKRALIEWPYQSYLLGAVAERKRRRARIGDRLGRSLAKVLFSYFLVVLAIQLAKWTWPVIVNVDWPMVIGRIWLDVTVLVLLLPFFGYAWFFLGLLPVGLLKKRFLPNVSFEGIPPFNVRESDQWPEEANKRVLIWAKKEEKLEFQFFGAWFLVGLVLLLYANNRFWHWPW